MTEPIILYDIPGKNPKYTAWSPSTWKTRYGLAYKGLPFKTEWVEYPDIESLCKKLGAPPTWKNDDGSPLYTLPVIYDPSTKTVVEESFKIAKYLDKTYPNTPRLIPDNTAALQSGFRMGFELNVTEPLWDLVVLAACNNLNPRSQEFFRRTREANGKKLETYASPGEVHDMALKKVETGLKKVSQWFDHNDGTGPFVMGDIISHADFALAGRLMWGKVVWGEDSEDWRAIMGFENGRWERYMKALEKYEVLT
ncbi:hypothetical protein QCA50_006840 [Cerrena zonata]|uniref:GST N-terminal domain-containing protein n=1 Tax=Cerrena zonata TaxID=2478898 RepID=A0AAW0GKM2_9APHY